ncbi:MAG TPA: hypothetical protein VJ023_06575 [Pyrinomonadaceae bacterium]|nr:hypothetical protein [Pyrinomonadaceae bacterium]
MENPAKVNPVVEAVIKGTAPHPARLAAARGLLPLSQSELLEVLVALRKSDEAELAEAADATLSSQEPDDLLLAAKDESTVSSVLEYFARNSALSQDIHEAIVLNTRTPDGAIMELAATTFSASLLEFIALNQRRLINTPGIIDAVLQNPSRSPEAERRVRETRKEFFEKERGARQVAEELRARGNNAAAEFFETAELDTTSGELSFDDLLLIAQHIEVVDADIDDSWLPAERYVELQAETSEEHLAAVNRVLEHERLESGDMSPERVSLIRKIMFMNARDRMKLAMKGDREARGILVRDPNRVVCAAVINNPRVTDQEVEGISAMRTVSDEVLRLIALNRSWARSYPIIHNLVRNPRCPIPTVVGILPRIRTKDLQNLSQNRNVSDAVRRQALRLMQARSGE